MGRNCCVPSCKGNTNFLKRNRHIGLHRFPNISQMIRVNTGNGTYKTVNRRKAWIQLLQIKGKVTVYMKVCGLHFAESDYFKGKYDRSHRILKRDVVPSQNLPKPANYEEHDTSTNMYQENQLNVRIKHENTTLSRKKRSRKKKKTVCSFQIHDDINLQLFNTCVNKESLDSIKIEEKDAPNNISSDLVNNDTSENTSNENLQNITTEIIIKTEPNCFENFDCDMKYEFEHTKINNHVTDVPNINEDKSITSSHFEEILDNIKTEEQEKCSIENFADKEHDLKNLKGSNTVPSKNATQTTLNPKVKLPIKITFDCENCGKSFIHPMYLDKHQRKNCIYRKPVNTSYVCDFCNKVLKNLTQLMKHRYSHTREKCYVCDMCNKKFLIYSYFNKHNCIANK